MPIGIDQDGMGIPQMLEILGKAPHPLPSKRHAAESC
jgi:hypothetical protein